MVHDGPSDQVDEDDPRCLKMIKMDEDALRDGLRACSCSKLDEDGLSDQDPSSW